MSMTTSGATLTADELLNLPDAKNYELVDGKLVERNMGMESCKIGGRIFLLLGMFLNSRRLGHLFPADASYHCFSSDLNKVRKPDVSFVLLGRLAGEQIPKGHCLIPPDLAVEVISPGDLAYEVEDEVEEYLGAGVPLIWVVHPPTRTVRIHRQRSSPRGSVQDLKENDVITGEDVLPEFSCAVKEFFE